MIKRTRTLLEPQDVETLFNATRQPKDFSVNLNGTYQFRRDAEDDGEDQEEDDAGPASKRSLVRVLSPFKVIRRIEHVDGDISVDCAFIDTKGRYVCVTASSDEFLGADFLKKLSKKGFKVYSGRGAVGLLRAIYNDMEPEVPTVRVVAKQGIQQSGSFVLDELVLGDEHDLVVDPGDPNKLRGFSAQGTIDQWIADVSRPALASSVSIFAISHSFAALLKYGADLDNAVFNLFGPSSKGKTSALFASASTMGPPKKIVGSWLATASGFEAEAKRCQGWSWIIDEARIGLKGEGEENIIFALAQGRTKSKATSHGGAGVELGLWALSSQEEREDDAHKGQPNSGADVRLFTIPAGYDLERGIFESAQDVVHAKAMADGLQAAAETYYGTPIIEFSVRLLEMPDWRSEISTRLQTARTFLLKGRTLDAVQGRALDSFTPIAAAGEWATELGVTGWTPGDATNAVKAMFEAYLAGPPRDYWRKKREHESRSRTGQSSPVQPVASLDSLAANLARRAMDYTLDDKAADDALAFLRDATPVPLAKLIGERRYPDPKDDECPVFIITRDEQALLCVAPKRLKQALNGRDDMAVRRLRERGILVFNGQPTSLRFTLKVRPDDPRSFYAFSYAGVVGVGALQP
jgi:hypothetical protein